jgi:hypothetical protein
MIPFARGDHKSRFCSRSAFRRRGISAASCQDSNPDAAGMPRLVCSLGRFLAQPITAVVVVSFWFFFFVDAMEMVDNPACRFFLGTLSARPCGKIGWEAEACRVLGLCKTRNVDVPRLLSTWSTVEDRTLSWAQTRMCKTGPVATQRNERIVS